MSVTREAVEEKVKAGEDLTQEEKEFVMSEPVDSGETSTPEGTESGEGDEAGKGTKKNEELGKTGDAETKSPEETAGTGKADPKKPATVDDDESETARITEQLNKPDGQEDLTGFSARERGYFYEMRKDRKKAQELQARLDTIEFKDKQKELKEKQEQDRLKAESQVAEILNGKEDDDTISVGEVKKLLEAKQPKPAAKTEDNTATARLNALQIQNWELKAKQKYPDLDDLSDFFEEVLGGDKEAEARVAKAVVEGENPAEVSYELVKKSAKWPEIERKIKAKKAAAPKGGDKNLTAQELKDRAERIKNNAKKPTTVGSGAGGGGAENEEYTLSELANMRPDEFAKLPAAKRKELLEKFGSDPNL